MKEEYTYNYCHIVGLTDVGCKRQANEDNMANFETINGLASVVCDGMGGHVGGATASRVAIEAIHAFLDTKFCIDPREAIGEAIDAANQAILQQAMMQPELQGMGSTCVLLLIRDAKVYIGHVGDSRIYLIRNRRIKQLTKDHSYVQMLVDMGQLSPEQAEHHPRKNEITNALGIPNMQPATVQSEVILPEAGDCFLLCSDGLSGMVTDKEIERIVSRQSEISSQERVDCLVRRAKQNGGLDNITVQLVEFSITPHPVRKIRKKPFMILGILMLLCLAGGVGYYWSLDNTPVEKDGRLTKQDTIKVEQGDSIEIYYGQRTTEILVRGDTIQKRPKIESDSLRLSDGLECSKNNSILKLNSTSTSDCLWFSLADSSTIYKFIVVKCPKEKRSEQYCDSTAFPNPPNGLLDIYWGIAKVDSAKVKPPTDVKLPTDIESITYEKKYIFTKGALLLSFEAGKKASFTIHGHGQDINSLNCTFIVKDVKCISKYFKSSKIEPAGFEISLTEHEPVSVDSIVIRGEKVVENVRKSYNIIIKLTKVQ